MARKLAVSLFGRSLVWLTFAIGPLGLPVSALALGSEPVDVTDLPFEQLLETEIITADKLARQISDAASAVSVVTAQDIRTFGYRTLSDILNGMRGLNMAHDGYYGLLGGRGYGKPGDYAGRIALLIDGYRAPDNFFGQSYFGEDGLLDVALIERVEYIPGSGSSSYGDSAFLGVVNVITKKGGSFGGTQVSQEFGSHNQRRSRLTFGKQFDNGVDLLFSASTYGSDGRVPRGDDAVDTYRNFENENNNRYFLKAAYQNWSFETAWAKRSIENPYGASQTASDDNAFASLRYDGEVNKNLRLSTHVYSGRYIYHFDADVLGDFGLESTLIGRWRGLDAKLVGTWFDRHTLVFGAEYRNDFRQGFKDSYYEYDEDLGMNVLVDEFRYDTSRRTVSVYAYDDISLDDTLQLNLGLRQDSRIGAGTTLSPRAAIIYTPRMGTTLKLSSGTANRQPTVNEELWTTGFPIERVRSNELVWEQQFARKTRLTTAFYRLRIDRRPEWNGGGGMLTKGAEAELEHIWDNGIRLRTSYAWQSARDYNGFEAINVPRHNAKFNLAVPLGGRLRAGLEIRHLGRRPDSNGGSAPSNTVADLTLSGWWLGWSAALSVRNVSDTRYREVTGYSTYPMDGRNFWLQLGYDFK